MSRTAASLLLFLLVEVKVTNAVSSASPELKVLVLQGTSKITQGCGKWHVLFGVSVKSFPVNAPIFPYPNYLIAAFASIFT